MISPFILAGAMSPVTVAGLSAQALAEALSGMAYLQLVRPGAPVVFGTFASTMSMASGAPTFGTPEAGQAIYVMAALARRVGVPFRSGGQFTSSKAPDAQAAYESAHTLLPTLHAGVNFVLHAAGWLEGGLALSYEKLILDADQLGAMSVLARGVDVSDNGLAIEAFRSNAHGDHFLGNPHTLANFETAFWRSELADENSYEQWAEEGSLSAAQRANARWKQMLADYEAPPARRRHRRRTARLHSPPQSRNARRDRLSLLGIRPAGESSRAPLQAGVDGVVERGQVPESPRATWPSSSNLTTPRRARTAPSGR